MSDEDYESEDMYWEEEAQCCFYGFEFCIDPETRDMGLCTTDCDLYLESLEEES